MFLLILLATNSLPIEILHDYSCIDNVERMLLKDTYHRITKNAALVSSLIYRVDPDSEHRSFKISDAVRDVHKGALNIYQFRNMVRYEDVLSHLARLLSAGGIWTINCEKMYERLSKSRVHQVCHY